MSEMVDTTMTRKLLSVDETLSHLSLKHRDLSNVDSAIISDDEDDDYDDVFMEDGDILQKDERVSWPTTVTTEHWNNYLPDPRLRIRADHPSWNEGFDSYKEYLEYGVNEKFKEEEQIYHKTILVGDSGVGKTSLVFQFDTGQFEPQKFAATVGIGFTILLIGDAAVGKTSTLLRFKDNRFEGGSHMGTVGIDYRNKVVKLDDEVIKLQIWDTAGQERFRSITHAYYRDAHALLLLYEVSNRTTFDNTRAWLAEIYEYASPSICIMLIGNKCDSERREVAKEDGKRLADEYGIEFLETSAKTGYNVDVAFKSVARRLLQTKDQAPQFYRQRKSILEPRQPTTQSCTCG